MKSEPTDKNVSKYKDFNKVLVKYRSITFWTKMTYGIAAGLGLIATISVTVYLVDPSLLSIGDKIEVAEREKDESSKSLPINSPLLSEEVIVESREEEKINEAGDAEKVSTNKNEIDLDSSSVLLSKKEGTVINSKKDEVAFRNDEILDNSEYEFFEAVPKFGFDSLYSYLNHVMLPLKTPVEETKGTVVVMFEIGLDGKAKNVRIVQGLTAEADQEALRLITIMPEWNPASLNGQTVESTLSLPVHFDVVRN